MMRFVRVSWAAVIAELLVSIILLVSWLLALRSLCGDHLKLFVVPVYLMSSHFLYLANGDQFVVVL